MYCYTATVGMHIERLDKCAQSYEIPYAADSFLGQIVPIPYGVPYAKTLCWPI